MSTMQVEKRAESIKRLSFEELGVSRERYLELRAGCSSGAYSREILLQACRNMPEGVEEFILKSVTEDKSFDALAVEWELGRMERLFFGRTNFYALRRKFYGDLSKILREREAESEAV